MAVAAHDMAQHQRHLGAIRRLAGAQDECPGRRPAIGRQTLGRRPDIRFSAPPFSVKFALAFRAAAPYKPASVPG